MAGFRQKWLPPPTIDDYMYEVATSIWWNERERAKRQLIWLMEMYYGETGDTNDEETTVGSFESQGGKGKKRKGGDDRGVECH